MSEGYLVHVHNVVSVLVWKDYGIFHLCSEINL
jgi:hypothetical protein